MVKGKSSVKVNFEFCMQNSIQISNRIVKIFLI
jgi:hypothetical protein